ncbi:MAG TPA: hypothetical protein VKU79_02260 [Thermoplasmataceae archaeon]|nr:hypothetical protein [Thermoplasmataceae archaeon]
MGCDVHYYPKYEQIPTKLIRLNSMLVKVIEEAKMDEKGRINIGKETIKEYGDRFFIVKLSDEIVLIPRPKDPVNELRNWGKKLGIGELTAKDIEVLAEEEADKEISARKNRRAKERR